MEDYNTDNVQCRGRDCGKTSELGGGFTRREALNYHEWARHDAYNIFTGHYCDECYENNYPYKKDKYDYEGNGERLDDDEPTLPYPEGWGDI
jgi:hypothetical protein